MWRLGDLSIGGPVVLGPMSGYTSAAYREFMRPFGVSMAYTEMVSDQGLKYGGRQTMSFLDFRSAFVDVFLVDCTNAICR